MSQLDTQNTESSAFEYIKSLTLLCVEDSKTTQLAYEAMLEDVTNNIYFADDGEEGLQQFLDHKIDIIITDYDMPKLNGIEMIQKIRLRNKNIPIILVTGIEDTNVILEALHLNVNNFIKKPINANEVLDVLNKTAKLVVANRYIEEQKKKKLKVLEEKEKYNSYQEDLAFAKELNILRNDFYYKLICTKNVTLIDFLYQPLDVVSGDAYSARLIDRNITFYLLVDGMGKGLSASLSAMLITSFINHLIDNMLKDNAFDLNKLVDESIEYIKPILLDEEALAIDYILMNNNTNEMKYAKFAMPKALLQNTKQELLEIKSNNSPISKYTEHYTISNYDISDIEKFLFYSDGVVENSINNSDDIYANHIEEDFKNSFTKDDMKSFIFDKIKVQEDDISLIFINRVTLNSPTKITKVFGTSLEDLDQAGEWYNNFWEEITQDIKTIYNAGVVFTELIMNAYEHGNLGISLIEKNNLLQSDTYFDTLTTKEKVCDKSITVEITKIDYKDSIYIMTHITDEGEGFDTHILSQIFRNTQTFNGRGVFVSRESSLGIYYNDIGNSVLFIHKIEA